MIWDYRYILVLLKIVTELLFFVLFDFGVEIPPFIYIPQVSALFFNIIINCIFWFPEFSKFSTVKLYYFNKKKMHARAHTHTQLF